MQQLGSGLADSAGAAGDQGCWGWHVISPLASSRYWLK
jgi:hypothetical protein